MNGDNIELLEAIDSRTSLNRWIYVIGFLVTSAMVAVLMLMVTCGFSDAAKSRDALFLKIDAVKSETVANKAAIEASNNQYIQYIKTQIEIINKLQKDNKQVIKVPKAVVPPPPGEPIPSDKELDRPDYEHPIKTSTPSRSNLIQKGKAHRPAPTPKPWTWRDMFRSTR